MSKIEIRQLTKTISKTAISLLLVFVWGLTGAHAQSRLTPISGAVYWGKGMLNNYDTEINRLLLPSSYRFAYIVEPSFSTEYCLVGDDNNLILRKAEQKVWSVINTASIKVIDNDSIVEIKPNDKPQKVSIKEYQLQISPTIVDSISNLIESAVLTSSYFSDALGCDGTTFVFISWPYTAKCWSPTKDSNCKRLIALADSICKAVELNDSMLIKRNLNKISELHQTFKALYIEKPSEEYPYLLDYTMQQKTKKVLVDAIAGRYSIMRSSICNCLFLYDSKFHFMVGKSQERNRGILLAFESDPLNEEK